jgi:predicted short-subunit dehydrogenase-like oxidoreductase (DUF2520 family)
VSTKPPILNIIGCGKVGQTLGFLLHTHGVFSIQDVVSSSLESASLATAFVGAGNPCKSIEDMRVADVVLIATPDSVVADVVGRISSAHLVRSAGIVFHCSGALSSEALSPLREYGALVASVHPVKSFSSVREAIDTFSGTYCGIEGDKRAVAQLSNAFEKIGASLFPVKAESKVLYHASFVFACNYLTALLECAFQCCDAAGIEREDASKVMHSLVSQTVEAIMSRGVDSALTGPVARGDVDVIANQLESVGQLRKDFAEIYRLLGRVALEIAERQGLLSGDSIQLTGKVLDIKGEEAPVGFVTGRSSCRPVVGV